MNKAEWSKGDYKISILGLEWSKLYCHFQEGFKNIPLYVWAHFKVCCAKKLYKGCAWAEGALAKEEGVYQDLSF